MFGKRGKEKTLGRGHERANEKWLDGEIRPFQDGGVQEETKDRSTARVKSKAGGKVILGR